ncbi:reverse transcriptase domain, reverse transcriptase zinc-binding domain protein, partial [Tanacetum coccineum]
DLEDKLWWKDMEENLHKFSVAQAWQAIRPRALEVKWSDVVWFSQCIPHHAFLVWLLIGENLKIAHKRLARVVVAKVLLVLWFSTFGKKETIGLLRRRRVKLIKYSS